MCLFTITNEFPVTTKVKAGDVVNRQTSSESASLPQYDEGTESAAVATSDTIETYNLT